MPPLQVLPRERKEQLDQIPHPLYLEDGPDEQSSDTQEMQGNMYPAFTEEEYENMDHQEANHDREGTIEEEYMDYYCKQYAEFMQAQPQCKYDLRSSKNRTRELEQQRKAAPQVVPLVLNKGKGKLNPNPSKIKVSSNEERTSSEGHIEKGTPILPKTTSGEEEGTEPRSTKKIQLAFNHHKGIEKVKNNVPLIELLK